MLSRGVAIWTRGLPVVVAGMGRFLVAAMGFAVLSGGGGMVEAWPPEPQAGVRIAAGAQQESLLQIGQVAAI